LRLSNPRKKPHTSLGGEKHVHRGGERSHRAA
jgi:hypothetical protein